MGMLADVLRTIVPVDPAVAATAAEYHLRLTKPPGSLGLLESIGCRLAAIADETIPPLPRPAAVAVFAGDHGVLAEGVSPWPQEVTGQMVLNFCAGGAAINAIAGADRISVTVVDVGVATPIPDTPSLRRLRVRSGTANLRHSAAMSREEAIASIEVGITVGAELIGSGARCLVPGDMGIGNTTPSAAIIAAFTGGPPADLTGRGTGIDDATLTLKQKVIGEALDRLSPGADPLTILSEVGGCEIGAIAGLCLAGAVARVPVITDGVIALAGACVAVGLSPAVAGYLIAGHRSTEPAASAALDHLGLEPVLDLGLRLGEGTGATLAVPIVTAAAAILREMATFDGAGVASTRH